MVDGGALDPLVGPQCSLAVQLRRATRRGHRPERRARRDLAGAATRPRAACRGHARGRAGHRQDAPAARRRRARRGARASRASRSRPTRRSAGRSWSRAACSRRGAIRDTAAGTPAEPAVRRVVEAISGRDEPGFETPVARRQAPAGLRPRGRRGRAARRDPPAGAAHRRRPVGRRRHPAAPPVRRPERRRSADLPVPDDPAGRVRVGHRGRQLRRRHGADGPRPAAAARPVQLGRDRRAPEAGPRRAGRGRVRGGDARPVRGRAVHRRGAGPDAPRGRHAPADRRRVAARPQRGAARPVGGSDAHRSPRRAPPGADPGGARRRGDPRPQLQPARPPGDPSASGRQCSTRSGRPTRPAAGTRRRRRPARRRSRAGGRGGPPARRRPRASPRTTRSPTSRSASSPSSLLSAARRRQVHAAVVDLLLDGGDPAPAGLPMLAQHALAAGDTARAARFSIDAAAAALASNAPEEALRLVEQALPVVSSPADRRVLLATRDDAFAALRRTGERLDGLTELAALAEAMRDPADRARRPASARVGAADEPRRGRRRGAGSSRPRPRGRAGRRRHGAPGDPRARPGAAAEPRSASRSAAPPSRSTSTGPRRPIAAPSSSPSSSATIAAWPPPSARSGMIDFARGRAWFADEVLAGRGERDARGGGRGRRLRGPDPRRSPIGPQFVEAAAGPRAGARHLRTARRPDRRHVDGHRDGLRAVRRRSCTSRPRRGTSRRSGA